MLVAPPGGEEREWREGGGEEERVHGHIQLGATVTGCMLINETGIPELVAATPQGPSRHYTLCSHFFPFLCNSHTAPRCAIS